VILIYHNIFEDLSPEEGNQMGSGLPLSCFKEQILWLRRHRRIIPLSDYLEITEHGKRAARGVVTITFDDGLAETYENVSPVLRDNGIPATFFISTSHLEKGGPLWFSYVAALCYEGVYNELAINNKLYSLSSPEQRDVARHSIIAMARASGKPQALRRKLSALYPLPPSILDKYKGMTYAELSSLANNRLFECAAHTVSHPYLDLLPRDAQAREIFQCKYRLADMTGKRIRYFAYPSGFYNRETLSLVREAGFEAAFATFPKNLEGNGRFEIGRTGIYSTSLLKFWLKMFGVSTAARRMGILS
jgi:peptidoglycan/xylan/chitin deacetylase (PgdA/CDA1 family)